MPGGFTGRTECELVPKLQSWQIAVQLGKPGPKFCMRACKVGGEHRSDVTFASL